MTWVLVAVLVAATALVGLGFAAYWPEYPPIDDTPMPSWNMNTDGRHRAIEPRRKRKERAAELDEFLEEIQEPAPEPTAEAWMFDPGPPEAKHRWEHLGEGTQRIERPPPEWPPHGNPSTL